MGKKILVIGQGGREHALVWKLAQSKEVEKIYAAPGNPGIAQLAECEDIPVDDLSELLYFAWSKQIDLTVVGPEAPLMAGIAELFPMTIFYRYSAPPQPLLAWRAARFSPRT